MTVLGQRDRCTLITSILQVMTPGRCPLLALSRHIALQHGCPLSGVKRTPALQHRMSGFDPKRTWPLAKLAPQKIFSTADQRGLFCSCEARITWFSSESSFWYTRDISFQNAWSKKLGFGTILPLEPAAGRYTHIETHAIFIEEPRGTSMADKQLPTNESGEDVARSDTNESHDQERREAVKKLGKYAAYTAPALLALMTKPAKAMRVSPTS